MRRLIGLASVLTLFAAGVALAAVPEVVLNDPDVERTVRRRPTGTSCGPPPPKGSRVRSTATCVPMAGSGCASTRGEARSYGAAIDDTTIVYEETVHPDTDLYFTDAVTPDRQPPPDGVNTRAGESRPSLSGDYMLVRADQLNRVNFRKAWTRIVLVDITTGDRTVLRERATSHTYLISDQVNGDWATFGGAGSGFRVTDRHVFRYQISTGDMSRLDNPGQQQYAGGVSDDGTVYLIRTGSRHAWACGLHTKIVRMPLVGPGEVIAKLPEGRDALTTFAFDEPGGSTTLYFDRITCRNGNEGIYRIPDADTVTFGR